ncbi:phosphatase PAP2 family protein [Nocardioides sp. zg-1228]|uniref:phosphatase PAP2 family protein n=1 Tax=Nocardioides sp. zg-1228 TaxID=2763008 RepID=UPI0016435D5C|nr:phosphatase PAP2 family protein [Nocardioides sp. zg-1228]MBC2933586.1 phosphatase PAP2 family protein [Nocardioides sp. zg-1228]QSF56287.1 phosphatase PAP2 family protein [Nocardioides sp. zg-1228]
MTSPAASRSRLGTPVAEPEARAAAPGQESRHGPIAQLLIAWSPLSAILLTYWLAQWITAPLGVGDGDDTNRLGAGLHVLGPARADEALLGTMPTVWLQARLIDGSAHWYDALAASVYVTHFLTIPLITAVVWFRLRDRFGEWLTAVLSLSLLGIVGYLAYPAAPPWLAAERGDIGAVERISHVGWQVLGLDPVGRLVELGQSGSNPVAAMPSLHAAAALLAALFLWPSVSRVSRVLLVVYPLAMAVTLVYTGEHYVVDVLAGWLVAVLGVGAARLARRRSGTAAAPGDAR